MKSPVSLLVAAAIAASTFVVTPVAVRAAPLLAPPVADVQNSNPDLQQVQHRRRGFYRGHRGHHHRRPGYRYHDGFWYPPAAFLGAVIIGGAIAAQNRGNSHENWCRSRYRSYRAWDNTFQPNHGPRRQCRSPYH